MNTIELQQTLPAVFAGRDSIISDVWHQSLTLKRGEAYLVEAASGTGKSSLCSYVYGYRNDYQGIICFDGKNIRTLSVRDWVEIRKCSISMLFQELRLFTELTAWENVQLKNSLTGFKSKKEIKAWFEQFGIADKWDTPIAKMSFGQQQRVALVRALCQPFDFIFLDEPISHLDEENGRIMSRILVEEADRQGAGIIVTSIGKHLELNYTKNVEAMRLVWKLLRQHISFSQLAGFFFANLCGMVIVLLSVQFYKDVLPVFTEGDSFMKKDYVIVSKKVSTLGSFVGKSKTFSEQDIAEISEQPFTKGVGAFIPSQFKVSAGMGMENVGLHMSTAMFFESVPDEYVDVNLDKWEFDEYERVVPIIIPRNYLNLYNFGFAQSRSLPQLSEGVMGMVNLDIRITGVGRTENFKGKIVGFSNRLNTILVPETFMTWANNEFAPGQKSEPSRLIVEVNNPTDDRIARFFKDKGYDTEDDKLDAGKTTWFLKVIIGIVLSVGLLISVLSFYILMLSIYLLLQKNTSKLENLLLIGYSPAKVALPYQMLTLALNAVVLFLSVGIVIYVRSNYMDMIGKLFPQLEEGNLGPALVIGVLLFVGVSLFNIVAVRRKVASIWMHKG